MKRDMDLIIRILKVIEDRSIEESGKVIIFDDREFDIVQYNIGLLLRVGYINAVNTSTMEGESYLPTNLTWEGHDFLDATRNESIMEKAKAIAKEKGLKLSELPFELIKAIAVQAAKSLIFGS